MSTSESARRAKVLQFGYAVLDLIAETDDDINAGDVYDAAVEQDVVEHTDEGTWQVKV